jgi:methionyl-tRNA formyltransferase
MEAGLDTGPILAQERLAMTSDDTSFSLGGKLAELAKRTAERHLPTYLAGRLPGHPQDETLATYAPQLRKNDGRLDLALSAETLALRVRAYYPWPGTHLVWKGTPLKVIRARAVRRTNGAARPVGQVVREGSGAAVVCGEGGLQLLEVQLPGKRPASIGAFLNGSPDFLNAVLE